MTVEQLARDVLLVLDKQAEYFRTRDTQILRTSKALEKALRMKCEGELRNAPKQGLLIPTEPNA